MTLLMAYLAWGTYRVQMARLVGNLAGGDRWDAGLFARPT